MGVSIDPIPKIKKATVPLPQKPNLKFKLKLKRRKGTQAPMSVGTAAPQTLEV